MKFFYDAEKFNQIHLIRTAGLAGIYLFVFFFNYLRLEEVHKSGYLKIFLPLTVLLLLFLFRNYRKQLNVIKKSYVEIGEKSIRQFSHTGEFNEISLGKIESIRQDVFRMYPRIILEDDSRFFSFINLLEMDKFISEIEKITSLKTQKSEENKSESYKKLGMSFVPTLAFAIFFIAGKLPLQALGLVFTINLILYLLYNEKSSFKRKILFVAIVALIIQAALYFVKSR